MTLIVELRHESRQGERSTGELYERAASELTRQQERIAELELDIKCVERLYGGAVQAVRLAREQLLSPPSLPIIDEVLATFIERSAINAPMREAGKEGG